MPSYTCDKLTSGQLVYEVGNRKIRLVKDIPASGTQGASFSTEWIDFDKINDMLKYPGNNLERNSMSLQDCFTKSSSNNGPMLSATLIDMGVIDKNYNVLKLL